MNKIRVLLVDDHFIVRRGLASSINIEADLQVVAEAASGEEALQLFRKHEPDLVMTDWQMPRMTGPEFTAALSAEFPLAQVVILSAFAGDEHIFSAAQAGAAGYLLKSAEREMILAAIRTVAGGGRYFPPEVAEKLNTRKRLEGITAREREVLEKVAMGFANKQIADALGITEGTVKIHIGHILTKLDARDRAHAATLAIQRGIIQFERK